MYYEYIGEWYEMRIDQSHIHEIGFYFNGTETLKDKYEQTNKK